MKDDHLQRFQRKHHITQKEASAVGYKLYKLLLQAPDSKEKEQKKRKNSSAKPKNANK